MVGHGYPIKFTLLPVVLENQSQLMAPVFSAELMSGLWPGLCTGPAAPGLGRGSLRLEVSGVSSVRFSSELGEAAVRRTKGR